ncbi:MAG: hypothetical protein KDK36_00880 [Leptospiraceae bacterium]|nr:hypothetical protein [Leptospiraceae bacterium]
MKIVNKYTESSKGSNSYKFDYIYNERKFTFFVSKKLYNQKNIGDTTDEEIKIGSLGIVYKLR